MKIGWKGMGKVIGFSWTLFLAVDGSSLLYAANSGTTHSVSVTVPSVLSLTASETSFTLNYSDYLTGSESDIHPVNYSVMCNGMTPSGRVEVKLGALTPDMDFKADAQPYVKQSGSASLVKSNTGYQTIGTAGTKMYDQRTDSGNGMTTRGNFMINYKMAATSDLSRGTYTVSAPTVTLYNT